MKSFYQFVGKSNGLVPELLYPVVSTGNMSLVVPMVTFFQFLPGYMLLYLYALRMSLLVFTHLFRGLVFGTTIASSIFLALALGSGYSVHTKDMGEWCSWIKWVSPFACIFPPIIQDEFGKAERFSCPNNPTVRQENLIVVCVTNSVLFCCCYECIL